MKEAAESGVVFDTIHGNQVIIPRCVSSLKRYFADNGIKVFEVGRKGSQHDYTKITADVVATHYDYKSMHALKKVQFHFLSLSLRSMFQSMIVLQKQRQTFFLWKTYLTKG